MIYIVAGALIPLRNRTSMPDQRELSPDEVADIEARLSRKLTAREVDKVSAALTELMAPEPSDVSPEHKQGLLECARFQAGLPLPRQPDTPGFKAAKKQARAIHHRRAREAAKRYRREVAELQRRQVRTHRGAARTHRARPVRPAGSRRSGSATSGGDRASPSGKGDPGGAGGDPDPEHDLALFGATRSDCDHSGAVCQECGWSSVWGPLPWEAPL